MADATFFATGTRVSNFEDAYTFCKERRLLRTDAPQCQTCNRDMTLVKNMSYKLDGVVFRCPTHKGKKKSIRTGSYFEDSHLSLETLLKLALVWAYEMPVTTAMEMTTVASEAAVQWFQFFRDVCTEWKHRIHNVPVNPPYTHSTVNHSQNFVDPAMGVHTNGVECFWNNCKRSFKKMSGTTEEMLASHIDEFLWRQFHGQAKADAFNNLLLHISQW